LFEFQGRVLQEDHQEEWKGCEGSDDNKGSEPKGGGPFEGHDQKIV